MNMMYNQQKTIEKTKKMEMIAQDRINFLNKEIEKLAILARRRILDYNKKELANSLLWLDSDSAVPVGQTWLAKRMQELETKVSVTEEEKNDVIDGTLSKCLEGLDELEFKDMRYYENYDILKTYVEKDRKKMKSSHQNVKKLSLKK